MKIVINLSPSDVKKSGSHFDLGMAIALLIQSSQIFVQELERYSFIGELSLNGDLRPCVGVLSMVMEAKNRGILSIVIPIDNIKEASLVSDINIFAFNKLKDVVEFLTGIKPYELINDIKDNYRIENPYIIDFQDVQGQDSALEFVAVAAAGGMFAMPREISLAHNGVLFLDEIAEFNKKTLDVLRQSMEDRKISVTRVRHTNTFPANFMLVAAMNPCPCGYHGENRCHCSDYEIIKYSQKLSGPIMDRIDIQKHFRSVDIRDLANHVKGPSSKDLAEKVHMARNIQRKRYADISGISCNAQMTPELIRDYCKIDEDSMKILMRAYEIFKYSARTYHKFLRVARTFADMEAEKNILKKHIIKALMCREIEKEQATMVVV